MLLRMFFWERGTPLGADSEPLVNNRTAGSFSLRSASSSRCKRVSADFLDWSKAINLFPQLICSSLICSRKTKFSSTSPNSTLSTLSRNLLEVMITSSCATERACSRFLRPTVQFSMTGTFPASKTAITVTLAVTDAGNMMPTCLFSYSRNTLASNKARSLSCAPDSTPAISSATAEYLPMRSHCLKKRSCMLFPFGKRGRGRFGSTH